MTTSGGWICMEAREEFVLEFVTHEKASPLRALPYLNVDLKHLAK